MKVEKLGRLGSQQNIEIIVQNDDLSERIDRFSGRGIFLMLLVYVPRHQRILLLLKRFKGEKVIFHPQV